MKIYRLFLLLAILTVLSACAASRKSAVSVVETVGDSSGVSVVDSSVTSETRKDSTKNFVWDYSHSFGSMWEHNDDEELIHELVTETTDSLGNKTTTTDRTTHRKNHNGKQTTISEEQRKREEQTSVFLSMLDSIANSRQGSYDTHWQGKDSVAQNSEKNTDNIRRFSPLRRIEDAVIFFVVVGLLGWIVARRINNKKQ